MCALAIPGVAQAATVTDLASAAGVFQTNQSFNTLVLDYNNDGLQDFVYSPQNGGPRQLWQNMGNGTFTQAAKLSWSVDAKDQHGCASADVDHNGLPDIYCALGAIHGTRTKWNSLFLQTTPGQFTDVGATTGAADATGRSYSATFLDVNHDGWPDLFVDDMYPRTDGLPTTDRLYLNLGDDPVTGAWLGFADDPAAGLDVDQGSRGCDFTADFNHDGLDDIVFCGATTMYWYRNNGNGTFTDVHSQLLGGATWFTADAELVDVTGDGIADLVYARAAQQGIRRGTATGTFGAATQTHAETAGRMVAVADANGDGYPDIYVLQGNGTPGCTTCKTNYPDQLWLNNGTGVFTQAAIPNVTTGSGDTVNAITLNPSDRHSDFIVANGANMIPGPLELLSLSPSP